MKEIKFRAFDEDEEFVYFDMNKGYKPFIRIAEILHRLDQWQQFTGFKDKNDKDIYEGDIVKIETIYNKANLKHITKVCFEQGVFILAGKSLCDSYMTFIEVKDDWELEIIGNIYENPELLKGV